MALNFPAKIYQILENESSDIIRWHTNGCAFRIVDHGRFEREIIPKYFRRKLKNLYFKRYFFKTIKIPELFLYSYRQSNFICPKTTKPVRLQVHLQR